MSQKRAIILTQCLKSREEFDFESEIHSAVSALKNADDTLYSIDNFSDGVSIHYAKALMDNSDEVIIILDGRTCESLGSIQVIINQAVRMKRAMILYRDGNELIKPYFKFLETKRFKEIDELQQWFK